MAEAKIQIDVLGLPTAKRVLAKLDIALDSLKRISNLDEGSYARSHAEDIALSALNRIDELDKQNFD